MRRRCWSVSARCPLRGKESRHRVSSHPSVSAFSLSSLPWGVCRPLINNLLKNFTSLCKAAEVPRCAFHSLRKSCCTNLLEGGVAPHAVQKILGHASLETTIKYYSKVRRDQIAVAREVSERYATGTRQQPVLRVRHA
ncbi:MAG: tyrosine-type recombinase/integrase [Phycisphaerae bacterium]|nr:tyrosine-type recombinase/integrase [Phycisphaerae bacterium]